MRIRTVLAASLAAVLALVLTGCGDDETAATVNTTDTLVVGIYYDQPGWGLHSGSGFSGFDVDMARYLARGLGYSDSELKFKSITPSQRVPDLQNGTVDMVLANLSYSPERASQIAMAGPYFLAGQDLLVRSDNDAITGPHSLDGQSVCAAAGTDDATAVQTLSSDVTMQQADDVGGCVQSLLDDKVAAVTSDDAVLGAYVQMYPKQVKLVTAPFSTELYSVGLPKASTQVDEVDQLIRQAYSDGSWEAIFDKDLATSGLVDNKPPVGSFNL